MATRDCPRSPDAAINALITYAASIAEADDHAPLNVMRKESYDTSLSCTVDGVVIWRVVLTQTWAGLRSANLPGVTRAGVRIESYPYASLRVTQTYGPRKDDTYNLPAMQEKLREAIRTSRQTMAAHSAYQQTLNRREETLRGVFSRHGLSHVDPQRRYFVQGGRVCVKLRLDNPNVLGLPVAGFSINVVADDLEPEQFDAFWTAAVARGLVE